MRLAVTHVFLICELDGASYNSEGKLTPYQAENSAYTSFSVDGANGRINRYGGSLTALLHKTLYNYADTSLTPYRSDLLSETTFL